MTKAQMEKLIEKLRSENSRLFDKIGEAKELLEEGKTIQAYNMLQHGKRNFLFFGDSE